MSREDDDMPRVITGVRADRLHQQMVTRPMRDYEEDLGWERLSDWFWPVVCWMTLIVNGLILGVVLAELLTKNYNAWTHVTSMGITVASYIACAFTYRYIVLPALLMKRRDRDVKQPPALPGAHTQ